MGWIADLVQTRNVDSAQRIEAIEKELDEWTADARIASSSLAQNIFEKTEEVAKKLDTLNIGNIHHVRDVLEGES